MKLNKKRVTIGFVTFLTFAAAIGALWLPASMSFGEGAPDPCLLVQEEIELSDFISIGLSESESKTVRKTTGTITRILKNDDQSRSFYIERLHPSSRKRSALKIKNYQGEASLSIGDYVSIEGTLLKDSSGYYVNDPVVFLKGQNRYGKVEGVECLSILPQKENAQMDGLFVFAPKFFLGDVISSNGQRSVYSATNGNGDPFYKILFDASNTEETVKILSKVRSMSKDTYFKAYGNLEQTGEETLLRVSSLDDLTCVASSKKKVEVYAINDFHGATSKIASLTTFFKEKKNENTVFINSGDMWQGSILSNTNRGELLTKSFDEIGFDAFTLGNHEFDWGLDYIKKNKGLTATPFLGANIYNWEQETKKYGGFADDLVNPYVVKDLDNGLRVGIIGIIGQKQITSITSSLVSTVNFKDPTPIVASLAKELRDERACDVVLLSAHAGQSDVQNPTIASSVDAVFCAHTHQAEESVYGSIPYIQGGSYGAYVSKVSITVDNGNITERNKENISFNASSYQDDVAMKELVASYEKELSGAESELLATSDGNLSYNLGVPRLASSAMAMEAIEEGYAIDLAMCNKARSSLYGGSITYGSLYSALPFDNIVYIAEVSGKDLLNEAQYNQIYRLREGSFEGSGQYTIAVLDYLLLHQDMDRVYDYFPSGFAIKGALTKEGEEIFNYRDITADFLREKKSLSASSYSSNNSRNNTRLLSQSVSF